jgi:hypothetical protein
MVVIDDHLEYRIAPRDRQESARRRSCGYRKIALHE